MVHGLVLKVSIGAVHHGVVGDGRELIVTSVPRDH